MTTHPQLLSVDEAMAEFQVTVRDVLGDSPPTRGAQQASPEEAEANYFRLAEVVLGLACPDPKACADPRCRRDRLCRHFVFVRDKQEKGISRHPRRTPGAEAVRYAVWVYMNTAGAR
jgi:hypothetical protein